MNTTACCLLLVIACADDDRPTVRVTVVGILATDRDEVVDEKLRGVAEMVRENQPGLTGFRIARTTSYRVRVGDSTEFPVCKDAKFTANVRVEQAGDGKISLTIHPPKHKGSITYSCSCGKFVPVLTRCETEAGDRLLIAVMAEPCRMK